MKDKTKEEITLKIKPNYKKYINVNRWFSYKDISFYLIIGGRGIGKTTGLNLWDVGDFKKNGNEFVYVRRYINELKKTKSMFDPLINSVQVRGLSHGLFQWEVNKTRIGYGAALTAQQTFKSGVDFSKVNTLIYDEAILPRGGSYRYLDNEIEMFFELISTVFRDRTGYKVFILGNNADIFNPYFEYFDIPNFERSYIDIDRGLYCELAKNSAELLEAEKETPLYKLTQGTKYFDYHYNNKVLLTEDARVAPKPLNVQLICRVVINEVTLNVYRHKLSEMYVELRDRKIVDSYSFIILESDKPNYHYIKEMKNSDLFKFIHAAYYLGDTIYESDKANAVFKMFMETFK